MTHDSAREVIAWWLGKAYPSGAGQFDLAHDLLTALQSAGYAEPPPIEPTAEMIAAGAKRVQEIWTDMLTPDGRRQWTNEEEAVAIYRAMLSAAEEKKT